MHADIAWQRTIDRQTQLRGKARSWRLCMRTTDLHPDQMIRAER
jgi:hypothetical protein